MYVINVDNSRRSVFTVSVDGDHRVVATRPVGWAGERRDGQPAGGRVCRDPFDRRRPV